MKEATKKSRTKWNKFKIIKYFWTQFQQINDHLTNQERYRIMVTQKRWTERARVPKASQREQKKRKRTHTLGLNHYYWTKSIYWVSHMIDIDFYRTFPHCDAVRCVCVSRSIIRNYFVNAVCYLVLLLQLRLLLLPLLWHLFESNLSNMNIDDADNPKFIWSLRKDRKERKK